MTAKQVRQPVPDRRNPDNADISILLYRMDEMVARQEEMRQLIETGFVKQEGRVTALEMRVGNLEGWRMGKDAVEMAAKAKPDTLLNDRLFQVIFAILIILAGVLGLNVTGVLK